jgi:hypothetical protein
MPIRAFVFNGIAVKKEMKEIAKRGFQRGEGLGTGELVPGIHTWYPRVPL